MMHEAGVLPEPCTVAQLQRWGLGVLAGDQAQRESELLLGHALGRDRAWLFAHAGDIADTAARVQFRQLVARRAAGEPVAQILGSWGFWTLDLRITPDTLVPRPETECLIETALRCLPVDRDLRIADLGTGSGAIALALAQERPRAQLLATDVSEAALEIARENAQRNRIVNIEFRLGDWYAPLRGARFDLIASNPPYIATDDPHLGQGDLRFEPRGALASGRDGLDAIRVLAAGAGRHLAPGGWILIEHGFAQGAATCALLTDAGLHEVCTVQDLEQRERVTLGQVRR